MFEVADPRLIPETISTAIVRSVFAVGAPCSGEGIHIGDLCEMHLRYFSMHAEKWEGFVGTIKSFGGLLKFEGLEPFLRHLHRRDVKDPVQEVFFSLAFSKVETLEQSLLCCRLASTKSQQESVLVRLEAFGFQNLPLPDLIWYVERVPRSQAAIDCLWNRITECTDAFLLSQAYLAVYDDSRQEKRMRKVLFLLIKKTTSLDQKCQVIAHFVACGEIARTVFFIDLLRHLYTLLQDKKEAFLIDDLRNLLRSLQSYFSEEGQRDYPHAPRGIISPIMFFSLEIMARKVANLNDALVCVQMSEKVAGGESLQYQDALELVRKFGIVKK
jgi:hypothetical protein